jgi:hypothetical protein
LPAPSASPRRTAGIVDTGAAGPETQLHGPFGRVSLR